MVSLNNDLIGPCRRLTIRVVTLAFKATCSGMLPMSKVLKIGANYNQVVVLGNI